MLSVKKQTCVVKNADKVRSSYLLIFVENLYLMDQRIINLFDEYTHKPLKREDFLKRLANLTGGMAAALAVLPMLEINYAKAETVPTDDDRIKTERIEYPGDGTTMKGYVARPTAAGKYPAVVVIHENRGLNPHIEDVTRRLALSGFSGHGSRCALCFRRYANRRSPGS